MLQGGSVRWVSGWTIKSACFQARTARAKSTRRIRSVFVHGGRFTWRLRIMSCYRKSMISITNSDLLLARSARVPSGNEEVDGLIQCTKQARSMFTFVTTSRLRRERIKLRSSLKKIVDFLVAVRASVLTSCNFTSVARLPATREGTLNRSYSCFFPNRCAM